MTSYVTPKKNSAFVLFAGLYSQSAPQSLVATPTLAAGDFKVSIDGGAFANLATLPTNTPGTYAVKFSFSAGEMNGDNITVVGKDAAGAEWSDIVVNIQTSAAQIDDLATAANLAVVDGIVDSILLDTAEIGTAGAGLTNINLPNQTMDITGSLSGSVGSVTGSVGSVVGHTAQTGDTYALANGATGFAAIDTVVDAILVDTGTSIPDTLAGIGSSGGAAISVDATVDNFAGGISGVTSGTTVVGTQAATTYANTSFDDGVYHDITHAANTLDVVYQFLTGGGTSPVSVTFNGYLDGANDTVTVSAWDHGVTGDWEAIGTIPGQGRSGQDAEPIYPSHRHLHSRVGQDLHPPGLHWHKPCAPR